MMDLKTLNKLEELKKLMIEENKNSSITKIENKINNKEICKVEDKSIHSNNNILDKNVVMRKPQRREIWMVNFGQRKGSIQSGIRPCIIGSNPINNKYANIRNVYPVTSKTNKKLLVHVELDESCGLKEKSLVLTEQVTTIDIRYDLLYYVGIVDEITMKRIDKARNIQLGDLEEKTDLEKLSNESRQYVINKMEFIETCKKSIEFYKSIRGDEYSISLAEDEKFKEENALKYYCYKNNIDYDKIYNDYYDIKKRKEESIMVL
jgi:mRNA-degrading endonuclease toxin of MazEF toxin-antitoxin module